jgi:hypothetical protein
MGKRGRPAPKPIKPVTKADETTQIRQAERKRVKDILALDGPAEQLDYLANETDKTVAQCRELLRKTRENIKAAIKRDTDAESEAVKLMVRAYERMKGIGV